MGKNFEEQGMPTGEIWENISRDMQRAHEQAELRENNARSRYIWTRMALAAGLAFIGGYVAMKHFRPSEVEPKEEAFPEMLGI